MELEAKEIFAGYRVIRKLGVGGMGAVYLVQHPRLPRHDAMKVVHEHLSASPNYAKRFAREADYACQLDHPSLVKIYDRGQDQGRLWLTMQYVEGSDMDRILRRDGPLGLARASRILTEIADALDHVHQVGLVHRDVKPANILVAQQGTSRERALLTDFGIAHGAGPRLTTTGELLASLPYAAPEQLSAQPVAPAADVYALGCVLFEFVTGRRLFPQEDALTLMAAVTRGPDPRLVEGLLSERGVGRLAEVVLQAVSMAPEDRFASCGELVVAARRALPTPAPETVRTPDPGRPHPELPSPPPPVYPEPDPGPYPVPPPLPENLITWPPAPRPRQRTQRRWLPWVIAGAVLVLVAAVSGFFLLGAVPDAPHVRAEATGEGVRLEWDPVEGAHAYEVRRDGSLIAEPHGTTTYVDADADSAATVTYTVTTVEEDGDHSDPSAGVTVTTALAAPVDLTATVDGTSVQLTWSAVEHADRYQVRRDEKVLQGDLTDASLLDKDVPPGEHTYEVVAVDDGDAPSSTATVTAVVSPWGDADALAAQFDELLPDQPGGVGWAGGTCRLLPLADDSLARAVIECRYPSGLNLQIAVYPDQANLDERITTVGASADPAASQAWTNADGSQGGWYRQSFDGSATAFEAWGFNREDRALMEMYVWWDGHTILDIDNAFFYPAPWR